MLITVVLPFGLREVWRRYRRNPMMIVLGGAGATYLVVLFLRFIPKAWEIGNRASEFLFLGVALIVALAGVRALEVRPSVQRRIVVAAAAVLLVAGGVIAGWPRELRLALPYKVEANGRSVEPQGVLAARWSSSALGTGRRFVADPANARLQLAQGQLAFEGGSPDLNDIIRYALLDPWMVDRLQRTRARFLLMDRRRIRDNQSLANYFASAEAARAGFFPRSWYQKFDRQQGVSRVFDSGDIQIYDVSQFRYDPDFP
jgi:hypothetical protein